MKWETVIGLETHAQLNTRSKMFSGAATAFGAAPNTQACAVDIALPGVLPVANREAVAKAVRFGLAIGANVNRRSIFARKNYFYPDLPKGYQISQYENPIVQGGAIQIFVEGKEKTVHLTRAHLEEDAGKSLHEGFHDLTGIDLNRAGTPLLEIVSEPDLRGAQEAIAYARMLHALVRWIGICDGNMQEGSFRCDANVSVRKQGDGKLGTRCEIKNLNSFLFMEQAIAFEARRQIEILEEGGSIAQETRLYDPDKGETRSMRLKEEAHDYRYFPDPDLLPLVVSDALLARAQASLPELPEVRRERLVSLYALTPAQASLLTASIETSSYALAALDKAPAARRQDIANWISGPLSAKANESALDISASRVTPGQLRRLAEKVEDGTLSGKMVKEVIEAVWSGEDGVDEVIAKRGLQQVSDAGAIEKVVDDVLAKNAKQVEDYRAGKEKAFNSLVGQVMKATQGKANPAQVNAILKARLRRP
jgi:aspartyl-tRNA(Asn)/glutamyl-tRNA(Gln) amidotransferase subunit B